MSSVIIILSTRSPLKPQPEAPTPLRLVRFSLSPVLLFFLLFPLLLSVFFSPLFSVSCPSGFTNYPLVWLLLDYIFFIYLLI